MSSGPAPDPSRAPASSRGHIPALDGVRGLAVLLVIALHVVPHRPSPSLIDRLVMHAAASGWLGVDLFFVLSGFLITGILLDSRSKRGYFGKFYARRTLRIFPLYYSILLAVFVVLPLVSSAVRDSAQLAPIREHQWWFWTYTTNFLTAISQTWHTTGFLGHFWSLAIEEQFYLIWPAVVYFCPPRRLLPLCTGIIVAALALRIVLRLEGVHGLAIYTLMPTRADSLAAGAWLAVAVRGTTDMQMMRRYAGWIMFVAFGALLGMFIHSPPLSDQSFVVQTFGFSSLAIGFAAMILLTLDAPTGPSLLGNVFRNRWLRFFGKYSYAMYCLHQIVPLVVKKFGITKTTFPGVTGLRSTIVAYSLTILILTTVASLLSWHLLEKHFLLLKKRFATETPLDVPAP